MIYDITDIINDTHQFSCLIEGGRTAHHGTEKGRCPENAKNTPPPSHAAAHPRVASLPLLPLSLVSLTSLSFTLECYSGVGVSSARPARQRAVVRMR